MGETASNKLKTFAEYGDVTPLASEGQGSSTIFDAFTTPPLPSGYGTSEAQLFAESGKDKVKRILPTWSSIITCVHQQLPMRFSLPLCQITWNFRVSRNVPIGSFILNVFPISLFMNLSCLQVSLVVKIVPSPDWFVGVDSLDLCTDGEWVDLHETDLWPLDAGTQQGN